MSDKTDLIQADRGQEATAIHLVNKETYETWAKRLTGGQRAALAAQKFDGSGYQVAIVPDGDGWFAVGGVANPAELSSWCMAKLAETLPSGTYRRADGDPGPALFGWQTAQYRFARYQQNAPSAEPRILLTSTVREIEPALSAARATMKVMDLVNTPAEDMGPAALEHEMETLAGMHGATLSVTKGDALEREYPMVHAVGRAAARHHAPRMLHLSWGKEGDPVLAIVGKGVCFDSGGLDVKSAAGMLLMKKDMGGAAHAIALAGMIMERGLKVRLHLLVPAVENAISANSFRPGDVLRSRQGLTVEIGNTDAEGRLILADALTRASEENPSLLIDFATLTGAARVALGPEIPALMARRDETANALMAAGKDRDDECWRLPLPEAYSEWLKSDIADMTNSPTNGFAGASVAGLFLNRFVGKLADGSAIDWAHFDTFAWRPVAKPGRPKGGAAYGLRASFKMILDRFG